MSIAVSCPSCGTSAKVPDSAAGRRGKCRGCGSVVQVPLKEPPPVDPLISDLSVMETVEPTVDAASQRLVNCSQCNSMVVSSRAMNVGGRIVCADCMATTNRAGIHGIRPEGGAVAVWERRLLWAFLLSYLGPLALVGISLLCYVLLGSSPNTVMVPLAFVGISFFCYATYRLSRAKGKNVVLYCVGSLVPVVNILVLLALQSRERPEDIRPEVWEVAVWERRMLWAFLLSNLGPLALVGIPLFFFVTYRLSRAMGESGVLYCIGCLIPLVNILVMLTLNSSAVSYLKSQGLEIKPFGFRWQRKSRS
jgi:hypothetical protein